MWGVFRRLFWPRLHRRRASSFTLFVGRALAWPRALGAWWAKPPPGHSPDGFWPRRFPRRLPTLTLFVGRAGVFLRRSRPAARQPEPVARSRRWSAPGRTAVGAAFARPSRWVSRVGAAARRRASRGVALIFGAVSVSKPRRRPAPDGQPWRRPSQRLAVFTRQAVSAVFSRRSRPGRIASAHQPGPLAPEVKRRRLVALVATAAAAAVGHVFRRRLFSAARRLPPTNPTGSLRKFTFGRSTRAEAAKPRNLPAAPRPGALVVPRRRPLPAARAGAVFVAPRRRAAPTALARPMRARRRFMVAAPRPVLFVAPRRNRLAARGLPPANPGRSRRSYAPTGVRPPGALGLHVRRRAPLAEWLEFARSAASTDRRRRLVRLGRGAIPRLATSGLAGAGAATAIGGAKSITGIGGAGGATGAGP